MAIPFFCIQQGVQIAGSPTSLYFINLVTGTQILVGEIQPSGTYNAIGYNVVDKYIYGYNISQNRVIRLSSDATAEILPAIPNLPNTNYFVGDVDLNQYLYLYVGNTSRYYVVDVKPTRSTYLQLVDPANSFQLQTSNYGVAIAPRNIADWAFNPVDNQLYGVLSTGSVVRINPLHGSSFLLATTGLLTGTHGAVFYDIQGNLYTIRNSTGEVYRITTTPTTATAIYFSQATASSNNDGSRCPLAQLDLISAVKSVDLTQAVLGDTLTYTIVVTNDSTTITTTNVIFTDPIPNGTTYVLGSATIDGLPAPGDPETGIPIGTLSISSGVTIEYQVTISNTTIPFPNPVPNTATVTYDQGLPSKSNTVFTKVLFGERGINFI